MTHTSWINEGGAEGRDNERLEYLGDAVLELVAGEYLFKRFPTYDEGQLTQMRSSLVSTVALAGLGEQLLLGEALRLGRGASKSGARRLTSLHANAFEALVGAAFLDQGYRRAGRIFLSRIGDLSGWTDPNFKGKLQALAQERFGQGPAYRTEPVGETARSRQYRSIVSVEGHPNLGEGRGGTKQAAEQAAAKAAVDLLTAPAPKRRGRRSASSSVPPARAETVELAGAQQVPVVLPPLASRPTAAEMQLAAGDTPAGPPRRRRRRSRAAEPAPAAAAEGTGPPPAGDGAAPGPPAVAAELEVAPVDPPAAPARRRRRRARPAVPSPPPSDVPGEGAPLTGDGPALRPPAAAETPEAAPLETPAATSRRRRRRARPAASSQSSDAQDQGAPPISDAPAPPPSAAAAALPEPRREDAAGPGAEEPAQAAVVGEAGSPEEAGAAGPDADPAQRGRRTHRGHRGGRGRSGRASTPSL